MGRKQILMTFGIQGFLLSQRRLDLTQLTIQLRLISENSIKRRATCRWTRKKGKGCSWPLFWSYSLSNGVGGSISATSSDSCLKVSFLLSAFLVEESGQVSWHFVRWSPSFFIFYFFLFSFFFLKGCLTSITVWIQHWYCPPIAQPK